MFEFFCYKKLSDNKEDLELETSSNYFCKMGDILSFLLYLLISIFAFYLSWECNTQRGLSVFVKLFYGFFAFIFGSLYLLFYIVFINGTCVPVQKI